MREEDLMKIRTAEFSKYKKGAMYPNNLVVTHVKITGRDDTFAPIDFLSAARQTNLHASGCISIVAQIASSSREQVRVYAHLKTAR